MKILLFGGNLMEHYILNDCLNCHLDFTEDKDEGISYIQKQKYDGIILNAYYFKEDYFPIACRIRQDDKSKNIKTPIFLVDNPVTYELEMNSAKIGDTIVLESPLSVRKIKYIEKMVETSQKLQDKKSSLP